MTNGIKKNKIGKIKKTNEKTKKQNEMKIND